MGRGMREKGEGWGGKGVEEAGRKNGGSSLGA